MNRWGYQQKAFVRGYALDGVVCPKPRKIGVPLQFLEQTRISSRLVHISNQEACDVKAGTELVDIIRMKANCTSDKSNFQVASSPPYFAGSPPSRAPNPLIQDEIFCNNNGYPSSSSPMFEAPSTTRRNGGYVGSKFGPKPGAVRIEGFNCSGDGRISAVA